MSQEKVEKYKQEKANRKNAMAKQKKKSVLTKTIGFIVAFAFVCWIGYSVYDVAVNGSSLKATSTSGENIEVDMDSINDYLTGISE